jgi:hypothetical protein
LFNDTSHIEVYNKMICGYWIWNVWKEAVVAYLKYPYCLSIHLESLHRNHKIHFLRHYPWQRVILCSCLPVLVFIPRNYWIDFDEMWSWWSALKVLRLNSFWFISVRNKPLFTWS